MFIVLACWIPASNSRYLQWYFVIYNDTQFNCDAKQKYLLDKGYNVFLCDQINVGENFRHLICLYAFYCWYRNDLQLNAKFRNAARCLVFIPFINEEWCKSKECTYEFNIALSTKNRLGSPEILPVFLEKFDFYRDNIVYPIIAQKEYYFIFWLQKKIPWSIFYDLQLSRFL